MKKALRLLWILAGWFLWSQSALLGQAPPGSPPADQELARELEQALSLYPNPSDGEFTVSLNHAGDRTPELQVYDLTGKRILDLGDQINREEGRLEARVDMRDQASGIYFLRLRWGDVTVTRKILIRR
ncbi:MAG: T9SS type A sorting domain-containing protein [Bacteroidales bacterium]